MSKRIAARRARRSSVIQPSATAYPIDLLLQKRPMNSVFKVSFLLLLTSTLPKICSSNSFSVGGKARAPSSFWSAGIQQNNNDIPVFAVANDLSDYKTCHYHRKTFSEKAYSSNQQWTWLDADGVEVKPDGVQPANPKTEDPPTNGFWPDPKAIREFKRRLREPKPVESSSVSNNTQKPAPPSIVVHHADREEARTSAPPVTFPPFTFTFSPPQEELPPVLNPNPQIAPQLPKISVVVLPPPTMPPAIPIEVLVHWIYDLPSIPSYQQAMSGIFDQPLPPPPLDKPPFLLEASDDVVAEYYKIVMDEKLTKGELKRALRIWKKSLPLYLQSRFEEAEAERQRISAVEQDLRAQRVTRLTPLARKIADQIEAIRSNDEFTVLEEEHLIRELMQNIPDGVREELTAQ